MCTVLVEATVDVEQILLSAESDTIVVGEYLQIQAVLSPENATDSSLVWLSDHPEFVSVDETGRLVGTGSGTATVRATAASGAAAEYVVTVSNPEGTLILPAALQRLKEKALKGCDMTYVIIPDGCTAILSRAFADCASLRLIRIPASVNFIAEDAFENCGPITILAPEGSKALEFAEENHMTVSPLR